MFPLNAQGKARRFTAALWASIIVAASIRLIRMQRFARILADRLRVSGTSLPRVCTVLLVLALAATITGWALEFTSRRTPSEPVRAVPTGNPVARTQAADTAPIAQMFGARLGSGGADIRLVGVIAQGGQGRGIALLAVDGQPALAMRAGDEVAAGVTLAEVRVDRVLVSRSGATQEIRLPSKPSPEGITKVPN
jgi:general secretion pathway protein C